VTLDEFVDLILTADPTLTKWTGSGTGNYTVWKPGSFVEGLDSDDEREEDDQRVYIDRFTKLDNDQIAQSIISVLRTNHIPFEYVQDIELDTGYKHHAFTCIVG